MMRETIAVILLTLDAACGVAQSQPVPAAQAAEASSPDADLTIHYKGPGVTAPELLPTSGVFNPIDDCNKQDGDLNLLIAVDSTGAQIVNSMGTVNADLLRLATAVLAKDNFKPGTADGAPAIVAVMDHMKLEACRVVSTDPQGKEHYILKLRSKPGQTFELAEMPLFADTAVPALVKDLKSWNGQTVETIGESVTAPVLVHRAEPEGFRKGDPAGPVLVSLIVDTNGMPQNVHILRSVGGHTDQIALKTVTKFRFKPAMKDGVPVVVRTKAMVNFRILY